MSSVRPKIGGGIEPAPLSLIQTKTVLTDITIAVAAFFNGFATMLDCARLGAGLRGACPGRQRRPRPRLPRLRLLPSHHQIHRHLISSCQIPRQIRRNIPSTPCHLNRLAGFRLEFHQRDRRLRLHHGQSSMSPKVSVTSNSASIFQTNVCIGRRSTTDSSALVQSILLYSLCHG